MADTKPRLAPGFFLAAAKLATYGLPDPAKPGRSSKVLASASFLFTKQSPFAWQKDFANTLKPQPELGFFLACLIKKAGYAGDMPDTFGVS